MLSVSGVHFKSLTLLDPDVKAAQDFLWQSCQCCDQHFLGSVGDRFDETCEVFTAILFLQCCYLRSSGIISHWH